MRHDHQPRRRRLWNASLLAAALSAVVPFAAAASGGGRAPRLVTEHGTVSFAGDPAFCAWLAEKSRRFVGAPCTITATWSVTYEEAPPDSGFVSTVRATHGEWHNGWGWIRTKPSGGAWEVYQTFNYQYNDRTSRLTSSSCDATKSWPIKYIRVTWCDAWNGWAYGKNHIDVGANWEFESYDFYRTCWHRMAIYAGGNHGAYRGCLQ